MITNPSQIQYFRFEEDFIEDNLRCIPMIVRLKLDTIGIKLTLKAWSRLNENERTRLALDPCEKATDISLYKSSVLGLAKKYSIHDLGTLKTGEGAAWEDPEKIPESIREKFSRFRQQISKSQWRSLTILQRFALVKLSSPGHESKNFEKAMEEFGLFNNEL